MSKAAFIADSLPQISLIYYFLIKDFSLNAICSNLGF